MNRSGLVWAVLVVGSLGACDCGGDGTDRVEVDSGPAVDGDVPGIDAAIADGGPEDVDGGMTACAEEICDNELDDDCDGLVEEGCVCVPGETSACWPGLVANRGVGACTDGMMDCEDNFEFGEWGACMGAVTAVEEVCDAEGVDEDCDGAVNEGCECDPGDGPVACGSDVGACSAGTQECVDGRLEACMGAVEPMAETCNGRDDDCDGTTDEGLVRACGSDVGACSAGTETCDAGSWGACMGGRMPGTEDCNGTDDDCDGMTDESLVRDCGSAVGACMAGSQMCDAGTWGSCTGGTLPVLETCDDTDEDCDGSTDEGLTRSCGTGTGVCMTGTETCSAGSYGSCVGATGPGTEACDGSLDEDCDGTVDEGCTCTDGATRPCGSDVGACMEGSQLCSGGGWQPCAGATGPVAETCNMIDDDCDGATDEMGICPTSPPSVTCGAGVSGQVLDTVSVSASGSDPDGGSVSWMWTVTSRPVGSSSMPSTPTSASTNFFMDAVGDYTLQACATDDEGEVACCEVMVTATPSSGIQVELSWADDFGDVDLHVLNVTRTEPDGWWTTDDCHWRNTTPDWGPAGAAANPSLDLDDRDGLGPENVTIDTSPAAGDYAVGVHYFCSEEMGPTEATIRVFCDGALIATYDGITLDGTDSWVTVAEIEYPACRGRSINDVTVGAATLPATLTTAPHCEIPCSSNADCPAVHRCARVGGGGPPRNICILDR